MDLTKGDNVGLLVGRGSLTDENLDFNDNFMLLEAFVQPRVVSLNMPEPFPEKEIAQLYVVPFDGKGVFKDKAGKLALFDGINWVFRDPKDGFEVYNIEDKQRYIYSVDAWVLKPSGGGDGSTPLSDSVSSSSSIVAASSKAVKTAYKEDQRNLFEATFNFLDQRRARPVAGITASQAAGQKPNTEDLNTLQMLNAIAEQNRGMLAMIDAAKNAEEVLAILPVTI